MTKFVIIGTGGHARSILDLVYSSGNRVDYFLSSEENLRDFQGFPVFGLERIELLNRRQKFIFGIGNFKIRNSVIKTLELDKLSDNFPILKHESAFVSKTAKLGNGTIIFANSYVGPYTSVGKFSIINTNSVLEHDCTVGDYNVISPSTTIAGKVVIGSNCFFGIGALVSNNISVGSNSIIAANSFVNSPIQAGSFVVGTPAQTIK